MGTAYLRRIDPRPFDRIVVGPIFLWWLIEPALASDGGTTRSCYTLTAGMSSRKIAASLSIGGTTVVDCLQRARAAAVDWPVPEGLSDAALEAQLFPISSVICSSFAARSSASRASCPLARRWLPASRPTSISDGGNWERCRRRRPFSRSPRDDRSTPARSARRSTHWFHVSASPYRLGWRRRACTIYGTASPSAHCCAGIAKAVTRPHGFAG